MVKPVHIVRARRVEEDGAAAEVEALIFPPYRHREMEQQLELSLPPEEDEDAVEKSDNNEPFELWACDVRLPCDTKDRAIFGANAPHAVELSVRFARIMLGYSGYTIEPSSDEAFPFDHAKFPLTLVKTIQGRKVIDGETRYTSAHIYAPHYHADFDMWFCPLQFPFLGPDMHQNYWCHDAAEAAEMGEVQAMEILAYHGATIISDD